MKREPKRLIPGSQLTTSAATYYTVATGLTGTISAMTATNTSDAVAQVTVWLVPQGSTAGDTNVVLSERSIAPGDSRIVYEAIGQSLAQGGKIQASASDASAINLVASGYETTP